MAEDSDGEKTEEPSTYRIEQFRKRGEVSSSKELTSILVLAACSLSLVLSLVYIYETLATYIEWLYMLDISKAFSTEAQKMIVEKTMVASIKCVAPVFLTALIIDVFSNVLQFGFLFAPEVLSLKFDRINPINGVKRLFTFRSVVEAIKGVFKFTVVLATVYLFIKDDLAKYAGFLHVDFANSFLIAKDMLANLVFAILLGLFVISLGDFTYQKLSYRKRLMQTKDELKREHKEQEGSPEIKQRIKNIQREVANKRMMKDIPKADVIVTNPTHISVALKYDPENMVSPLVLAKGADHLAFFIREIAKAHHIPLVENVPLARNLYKTVKVGEAVPRALYKAVAEVLAFVYKLKKKEKAISLD
ncbi:MAG: flagellar biosynthesis protein FlhB [Bdellovibrionales bacterium RIFOXYD12_FULL_39_22]|nr:MAG: flagellar biosynthesis protein FlhB [Bdellovibrionales bacterium RIFOXYB1_FULL_39_21]OFZ42835.1 MAG: flagellar biosynthesis protein FlhB [Bdellovibrionales bacterium RIFOXYC12_FULL_39_17]OFZ47505.1 MAG: flagellar biosynthesis protein FlhB [Bdellovibrionales bacterium RIFOXYC1_FULL_39_130]OFZ70854.1 MAG: flagellar biosynthesis protein FlhB [Bdellovibrionales bacterium RIFOXYC2_FULL_39_8]OFZ75593.1 MAG: flagellar biosynthesis protein FlhB [Bdellovibrionales bacterium RIFOXYD1_FULL_39_84]